MDFDEAAATWDDDEQRARRTRAVAAEIRSRLGDRTYRRALDFGTGTGALSLLLADRFDEVLLVDTSTAMLAVAAGKVAAAGPALAGRLRTLAVDLTGDDRTGWPEPGSVDVVYASMVLHHVADAPGLLATFHELVAPGGRLLLADLEDGGGHDERGGHDAGRRHAAGCHAHDESFGGRRGYRRDEVEGLLSAAGFAPAGFTTVFTMRREAEGEQPIFLADARRVP